jgi:hypothetical protein
MTEKTQADIIIQSIKIEGQEVRVRYSMTPEHSILNVDPSMSGSGVAVSKATLRNNRVSGRTE